jgi:hypothetical protein
VHSNIPDAANNDVKQIEKRYNIPQIMTKFSMPQTFIFTILPNPADPKDREHPVVIPNPPDAKKYAFVAVGEANLKRQSNSPSTCSRR